MEPTERDVEALATAIRAGLGPTETARFVLRSPWYAERIAQARREGAAELAAKLGIPTTASVPTPLVAGGDA